MLETFFLPVQDPYFYQRYDFADKVSEAMSMAQERFGINLAGPKEFDEKINGSLPLYISSKENDQDNRYITTESHGYIIMSSLESGEIRLVRFSKETGKEPLQDIDEREAEAMANAPPGYTPQVTTTYHYGYRDITEDELPLYGGKWAFNVNAAKVISNVHVVDFKGSGGSSDQSTFVKQLMADEGELPPLEHEACEPSKDSPKLPQSGFAINAEFANVQLGEPMMVHGSFNLPDDKNDLMNFVPVHVLIASKEFDPVKTKTLLVPKSKTRVRGEARLGAFSFDLMKELFVEAAGGYDMSDEIYISVISRSEFSQPYKIEIKEDEAEAPPPADE